MMSSGKLNHFALTSADESEVQRPVIKEFIENTMMSKVDLVKSALFAAVSESLSRIAMSRLKDFK